MVTPSIFKDVTLRISGSAGGKLTRLERFAQKNAWSIGFNHRKAIGLTTNCTTPIRKLSDLLTMSKIKEVEMSNNYCFIALNACFE